MENQDYITLEVDYIKAKPDYCRQLKYLEVEGLPWLPVIGQTSFLKSEKGSQLHTHAGCIEIVHCRRGTCDYESLGKTYRLRPGQAFISRPDEPHRALANPKGLSVNVLLFKLPGKAAVDPFDSEIRFLAKRLEKLPRLIDCGSETGNGFVRIFRLLEKCTGDKTERRLRLWAASMNLLLSILDASENKMTDGRPGRIEAIATEMREHPGKSYSTEVMMSKTGYSASSLLIAFKKLTGYTPHCYLVKCRVERAKVLLEQGEMSVTEIASELGYPSPQHFATQFRKATRKSPSEWRGACISGDSPQGTK